MKQRDPADEPARELCRLVLRVWPGVEITVREPAPAAAPPPAGGAPQEDRQ